MNQICVTIHQRLLEEIDGELVSNYTARKNWLMGRRNDPKTILSPFGPSTIWGEKSFDKANPA